MTLLVLPGAASAISAQPAAPSVTHGVVVGDVTARSAVLWARADRAATLNVTTTEPIVQVSACSEARATSASGTTTRSSTTSAR